MKGDVIRRRPLDRGAVDRHLGAPDAAALAPVGHAAVRAAAANLLRSCYSVLS